VVVREAIEQIKCHVPCETRRKSNYFPSISKHQTMKNMKKEVDLCHFE